MSIADLYVDAEIAGLDEPDWDGMAEDDEETDDKEV